MDCVEKSGKTLDEAKAAALAELGATESEVDFEVVEEPKKLLGLLSSTGDYRVRATLREAATGTTITEKHTDSFDEMAETVPVEPQDVPEGARRAQEFLAETTRLMGLETQVVVTDLEAGEVALDIQGPAIGLLIGRHGATLDALQLLAAVVANVGSDSGLRIIVDAENYRERRREMLRNMALGHAEKAKKRGQEVVIPDLKPYERRIIHLALRDDPEVETYSEGEGEDRCLVISPKNS